MVIQGGHLFSIETGIPAVAGALAARNYFGNATMPATS
jgi:hypothetical protein